MHHGILTSNEEVVDKECCNCSGHFTYLRNVRQIGNYCGLHAVIVPVLLQAGIPLDVFEKIKLPLSKNCG
jgi:hypothetical protein